MMELLHLLVVRSGNISIQHSHAFGLEDWTFVYGTGLKMRFYNVKVKRKFLDVNGVFLYELLS